MPTSVKPLAGGIDGSFVYEFRMRAGALDVAGYAMGALPLLANNRQVRGA